jgi:gluconate 2-dehydrogenase gamma chain
MSEEKGEERGERGVNASINRRRALQILGAVPVATALGAQQPTTPQKNKVLTPGVTSQIPTTPGNAPRSTLHAPRFFTPHEFKTASLLSDYIIPKDEHSGSATDAKVPEYMDYLLSERDANVNTQIAMRGGLAWLDNECRKRFSKTFVDASDAQRREVLDDIAYPSKAKPAMSYGVSFFNRFRDMTASGFYSSAIGWQDVKYIGNVFNPGYDGCPPAALAKLGVSLDLMKTRVAPEAK